MSVIVVEDRQGYNGWQIGDTCYRKNEECVIKDIHFHTNPPTITITFVSDPQREINSEFHLISKEPTQDFAPENEPMLPKNGHEFVPQETPKNKRQSRHSASRIFVILFLMITVILGVIISAKFLNVLNTGHGDSAEVRNALSLIKNAKNLDRTSENDELLRNARELIDNKQEWRGISVVVNDDQRRSLIGNADLSYRYIGDVQVNDGDYVAIRSNFGGLLYYNGTIDDITAIGEYLGDESLFKVETYTRSGVSARAAGLGQQITGENVPYPIYSFKNVGSGKYLDVFGGNLGAYENLDAYTQFTMLPRGCTIDESASLYRNMYAVLQSVNGVCAEVGSYQCKHEARSSAVACRYCNSHFRFEIYNSLV